MSLKPRHFFGIVLGALLVACGVLYILNLFGVTDTAISLDGWWTLFIILPCLSGVFTSRDKLFSLFGLAVGVLLLLAARGVFSYAMSGKIMVPVLVILLGFKLIVKAVHPLAEPDEPAHVAASQKVTAFFCESRTDFGGETLTAAKVSSIFGGATCNLRNADITQASVVQVSCIFGGVKLLVPEDVVIRNEASCIFGGISDRRVRAASPETHRTLVIRGLCLFGGTEIQ